jgi:hypothetical protein
MDRQQQDARARKGLVIGNRASTANWLGIKVK